ncbi:MAG: two-component regulator propeller domain-containing protein [Verrucomicrobiota bacterium]
MSRRPPTRSRWRAVLPAALLLLAATSPARGVILWNDPVARLVHDNGPGSDILGGAVKRDDSANDTLYFKFHVDPVSDKDTEEYSAGFELFEGDVGRLGIGNAAKAWAYSAFFHTDTGDSNNPAGYIDLRTLKPESVEGGTTGSYQYPRHGVGATIIFKVQYVPGEDDLVTAWLNPDLGPGANEIHQPDALTTRFNADAAFDEIRLRHTGNGGGWIFSDLAIATSFSDFVDLSSARPSSDPSGAAGSGAFGFVSWQKEQGLPQSPIRTLLQTRDGYLWAGTDEGMARFDGLRFVSATAADSLRAGPVSALLQDSTGAIWIGSPDAGLSRWDHHRLTTWTARDGLPSNTITALAEDGHGRLWIGTEAGLAWIQNGRVTPFPGADAFRDAAVRALATGPRGNVWAAIRGAGVFQNVGDTLVPVTDDAVSDLLKDPHCLLVDGAERLWIGAGPDHVLCRDGDRWHRYRIPRYQAKSFISSLAEEPDGTVWAGSAGGGLLRFKDGKPCPLPTGSGPVGSQVGALLVDREGRLWVGTDAALNRLRRRSLFTLSQAEGLGLGAVQAMAEVAPGIVWVAKPGDGLYRWDGKSFSRLSASGLAPRDSQITSMLVTRDGFCWVAADDRLLLYKDPIAAADEAQLIRSPRFSVIAMAEDSEGTLWAGTRDGKVWRLRQGEWSELPLPGPAAPVTALVPENNGSLWIGTDGGGLFRATDGHASRLDRSPGLPTAAIRTLHRDAQGALWIGTADHGLSRWKDGTLSNCSAREGLPDNTISQILEDDEGRLWLGSSGGIICISKQRLDDLAAGRIPRLYPQLLGHADGMLSEDCTGGFCPAGLKTQAGLLWFSTAKGVAVVNPRVQPSPARIPNTVLEEVLVDGIPNPLPPDRSTRLRLTPGKHRVEFRYTGLSFDAPDQIRFRYRLDGIDADWVDAGTRRSAFYGYLPPGSYQFRVAASSPEGAWSERDSGVQLAVLRHFWQSWWFFALLALVGMVAVGGTVRIVEKRKLQSRLKRAEQERALERERTRIAQDLHDEMGAKLCRISFLSEHARRGQSIGGELHDQISSISDASREVLQSLDEIVWAVNPQNDTLEHLASYIGLYATEYFQMTGIQCELDIPTQLPPHPLSSQVRHHLFLATHEALTNILKHSGATEARIAMAVVGSTFEIQVSDSGRGFQMPPADPRPDTAAPSGDGLRNMRQRLTEIGGHCSMESTPGQGTRIRFVISLKQPTQDS